LFTGSQDVDLRTSILCAHRRADRRALAIVAHVDHGKRRSWISLEAVRHVPRRAARRGARHGLGRAREERGITILAKNTAVRYKDVVINIVDTPATATSARKSSGS
jgi:GTP-binding protein